MIRSIYAKLGEFFLRRAYPKEAVAVAERIAERQRRADAEAERLAQVRLARWYKRLPVGRTLWYRDRFNPLLWAECEVYSPKGGNSRALRVVKVFGGRNADELSRFESSLRYFHRTGFRPHPAMLFEAFDGRRVSYAA